MYVDDMLIIGKKEQIQDFASKIKKEFSVKYNTTLQTTWVVNSTWTRKEQKDGLDNPQLSKALNTSFERKLWKKADP